jgi:hypothetical protein
MSTLTTARVLQVAGVLVAIGSYVSAPQNLTGLSSGVAHWVALVGGVGYVLGQALEHYVTHQQVATNTAVVQKLNGALASGPNPQAKP